jgi:hypothetical protein
VCVSMDVQLSAGTYVYAYAYQDSGGNLDINAAVASMHRIGA